ncbi:MAG: hypothetical protein ACLGIR_08190 [Actinomycetes bacterium]
MADGDRAGGARSDRLDRVQRPDGSRHRPHEGKEALYSTAPTAAPSSQVLLVCRRCDVESGLSVLELTKLAAPPFVWNPVTGFLWARCPACQRRSRLHVRKGQALRALLDRTPRR